MPNLFHPVQAIFSSKIPAASIEIFPGVPIHNEVINKSWMGRSPFKGNQVSIF